MAARKTVGGGKGQDKIWSAAIRRAVNEIQKGDETKQKRLVHLARKLVEQAQSGDISALKEIGDRLDGKPANMTTLQSDPNNPPTLRIIIDDPTRGDPKS